MTYSIKTLAAAAAAVATLGLAGAQDAFAATWGDYGTYYRHGRVYETVPVVVVDKFGYARAVVPVSPRTSLCETDEGVLRTVRGPAGTRCRAVSPDGTLVRGTRIPR